MHFPHKGKPIDILVLGNVHPGALFVGLGVKAVTVEPPFRFSLPELEGGERDDEFTRVIAVVNPGFPLPFYIPGNREPPQVKASPGNQAFPPYPVGIYPEQERIVRIIEGVKKQGDIIRISGPEIPSQGLNGIITAGGINGDPNIQVGIIV